MSAQRYAAVLSLGCLLLWGGPATAQEEEPGKDHPSVPRFPGTQMVESDQTDFDGYDFPVDCADKTQRVEGRSWRLTYVLKEGARKPSVLEIVRNYANQVKARGGRVVCQNLEPEQGWATLTMPLDRGERWLQLEVRNNAYDYTMRIIESAEMAQKLEFSADQMAEQLRSSGRLTLRGVLFDTGKTEIKPESNGLLDEVAAMLKANPDLRLRIEGHTDNVGGAAANLQLSKGRAAAVKTALLARGVAGERLAAEGYGDTRPVAGNATEDGRAQNRRVELVKQ